MVVMLGIWQEPGHIRGMLRWRIAAHQLTIS
jgi:hypothetical protein